MTKQLLIESFIEPLTAIPADLSSLLAPATHYLYEWQNYWIDCPGVDYLKIGETKITPQLKNLFCIRFENQLGLASIQAYIGQKAIGQSLQVEVLSKKFININYYLRFFRNLLDELFACATRLPFTLNIQTSRGVTQAIETPTTLFIFHFLCHNAATLRSALSVLLARPQKKLSDKEEFLPLAEAKEVDSNVLLSVLTSSQELVKANGFVLADRLGGFAPSKIWQSRLEETFDIPENRFILAFLKQLLAAIAILPLEQWWKKVSDKRKQIIRELDNLLRQVIYHRNFVDVGAIHQIPFNSRILMRCEGYRELFTLWQDFQHSKRPLFAKLKQAIELRNIANLYEIWVFFALAEEISLVLNQTPIINISFSDSDGLAGGTGGATASFGALGKLVYNQFQQSYSLPLRPDVTWVCNGRAEVIFDAKFKLERQDLGTLDNFDNKENNLAKARQSDIYKMHTYRDALGLRAAVIVYPGDQSTFYDSKEKRRKDFTSTNLLKELLTDLSGVGAVAMSPDQEKGEI